MSAFSDLKARGRRALHQTMGRPATYYPVSSGTVFQNITARAHSGVVRTGDLAGTNLSYAEQADRTETVIFLVDEVPAPRQNGLVIFAADEAYSLRVVRPRDGITITAEVVRVTDRTKITGKTLPDGTVAE